MLKKIKYKYLIFWNTLNWQGSAKTTGKTWPGSVSIGNGQYGGQPVKWCWAGFDEPGAAVPNQPKNERLAASRQALSLHLLCTFSHSK
ncbi:MAG: hypothetical protein EOO59_05225 [Hymenobacter sp.]|nr:MAG: hypothetical protein EOO59_05225 [Hymenobacter sp.]